MTGAVKFFLELNRQNCTPFLCKKVEQALQGEEPTEDPAWSSLSRDPDGAICLAQLWPAGS